MKIATARKKTSQHWRTSEITWEAFLDRLRAPMRTAETAREFRSMSKPERDAAKEAAGGFVAGALSSGRRKTENVTERSMITLDADHARKGAWETVTALLDYRMCSYTTHSHTEAEPRLRWIIPTSRPMTPDEYPAVARRVAEWLDIETMDHTTYEVARLMYWPTCSKDGPYSFHEQEGPLLDPDEVLATYGPGDAWKDTTLWPIAKSEEEIRKTLMARAGEPTEKPGLIGLFCRTYDVPTAIDTFLTDVYEPTTKPDRYTYTRGSTAEGAVVYNDGAFLFSNHATDTAGGRCVNAFDLVRIHKFGELDGEDEQDVPVTKLPSYAAMCSWASELPDIREQLVAERQAQADADFADLVGTDPTDGTAPAPADTDDWKKRLTLKPKSNAIEPTVDNIRLIIANDRRLKDRVCWNEFSLRRGAVDPLPWTAGAPEAFRNWVDADDAGLRWYLERYWGIQSRAAVQDAADLESHAHPRHPVREYLSGLAWDGKPRVATMLRDYLYADDTPLNREIAKRWMAAAVRRVFRPGCKFDTVLVLICPVQGIGKSQFANILSHGWFQDGLPDIGSKDAMQVLRGTWIVECGEMAATRKADNEAIKQFFSASTDRYRESYGRYEAEHPRQCVFIGSTNDREFILDLTGGRRFWPVEVHATIDDVGPRMDAMRAVRDQLWAEAYQLYLADTPSWFDEPEYVAAIKGVQEQFTQEDEWVGLVQAYLDKPLPDNWECLSAADRRAVFNSNDMIYTPEQRARWTRTRQTVTIAEIRNELLQEDITKGAGGNNPSSRHLGRVLNSLSGWRLTNRKTPRDFIFGRQKIFERVSPDETRLPAWAQ